MLSPRLLGRAYMITLAAGSRDRGGPAASAILVSISRSKEWDLDPVSPPIELGRVNSRLLGRACVFSSLAPRRVQTSQGPAAYVIPFLYPVQTSCGLDSVFLSMESL